MNGTIVKIDERRLGFEFLSTMLDKPVRTRHVWEIVNHHGTGCWTADAAVGKAAILRSGFVHCYLGNGCSFGGQLPQAGNTPAVIVEEIGIPRPQVKVETRWHNGQWQKLLKAKGWVAA